ncbi:MAG TPA: FIST N-terminal domain-containing protein [Chitinophagaceae bacterium]|nr:FIST N-terminal domain-containing protein [Chitinophagaceae bacterium]
MKAKSIKGKTTEDINAALQKSMSDGFCPTVAVVFIANDNEQKSIVKLLSEKKIQIFGASTGDNFVDGEIESHFTVILLLDINPAFFQLSIKGTEEGNTTEIAEQIGKAALNKFKNPAFLVVSGGLTVDGDEIIDGIERACGKGTTIFGGLAADFLKMERTYVFTNDKLSDNGLLALILDEDKISLNGMAVGGWKPMGMDRIITKSDGNVVYTIDNEPALDFISRYAGMKDIDANNALNFLISSNFQLQLKRENKHPVMRTPMQANSGDRSIVFAGSLPEGSKVRLCLLPGFEVVEEALNKFAEYKKEQVEADALIMFSCAGRQLTLGPYVSEEIDGIKNIWNAPMAGFFCYGEIGRVVSNQHEFHNMTCSLAMLKEK